MSGVPSLSPDTLAQIARSPIWQRQRIEIFQTPQGPVLVKGQRPAHGAWRYRLLNLLARLTGNPLLRAVPAHGGAIAQAIELRRLRELAALGVNVPAVLHEARDHIVLQCLSRKPLLEQFKREPATALAAWRQGLQAVAGVHRSGAYLSQGFARNLLCHDGDIWFIDFEDDPAEVMSLDEARTRDWLAYLHSSVWLLGVQMPAVLATWQQHVDTTIAPAHPAVARLLRQAAHGLAWLRHLPASRRPWGRDVVSAQALGSLLHQWALTCDPVPGPTS